jgi:hypothetical protein
MTELPGPSERRNPKRQFLNLPVRVEMNPGSGGKLIVLKGRTRDVSNRGAYFWASAAFHLGQALHLTWNIPAELDHNSTLEIRCVAEVIRLDPEQPANGEIGVAVRILHFGTPKVTSGPCADLEG